MTPLDQAAQRLLEWRRSSIKFIVDNFGVTLDAWQEQVCRLYDDPKNSRISMQACAGPGKTALLAMLSWHWFATHGERGEHPKGAAVSITKDNLDVNLWPELAKWRDRSAFLTRSFGWNRERIYAVDHPNTWFMQARSFPKSANAEQLGSTLSGLHSLYPFAVIDESGNIPTPVLRAAEQALSSAKVGKILQAGNPISHEGMLYAAHSTLRHQWKIVRVTGDPDDPLRSPRVDKVWAQQQIDTYSRENPWVMAYILGMFPPSSLNQLVSDEDVLEAQARRLSADVYAQFQPILGIDVARFGDDRTCFFVRQGRRAYDPEVMRHPRDSAASTDIATVALRQVEKFGADAIVMDATGGWAAGARDVLTHTRHKPISVQFHKPAIDKRYKNKRAELWFAMAEWIKGGAWLPGVEQLVAELSTPTYSFVAGSFLIEPKEIVKQRLGRSPDLADALALTMAVPDLKAGNRLTGGGGWLPESRQYTG